MRGMDEEKPSPNSNRLACVLGVPIGLFGVLMLAYGAIGVLYVIRHDFIRHLGGANTADDCFEAAMFLITGAVCVFVSIRWIRGPRRRA